MSLNRHTVFVFNDESGDKQEKRQLLGIKNSVREVLENNSLSSEDKEINLTQQLNAVATILQKDFLSNDCKVAAAILMVELYGHISLAHESSVHKESDFFIEEAYKLADFCETEITRSTSLNIGFIQSCNTFNISSASQVYELVGTFLSELKELAKEQPLFVLETQRRKF